jgi:hypothetical protein
MTRMGTLLPVAVNMARVMAATGRVEVLARKAIMDQKWESRFKSSEHGIKVLYDPDV